MSKDKGIIKPPSDVEAEQAVLACLLLEENVYDRIAGILSEKDFYVRSNGIIFDVIKRLSESDKPYDIIFVSSALKEEGVLEQIGGLDYLSQLTYILPNAANLVHYSYRVKEKAKLRELYSAGTKIQELVFDFNKDITKQASDAVDEAGNIVFNLSKELSRKDPVPIDSIMLNVYEEFEARKKNENNKVIQTGFYDLDDATNGLNPGALIIIAARPGMGKTSFALNIAQNAAEQGKTVVIFSLEMTSSQLVQRIVSSEAEVSGLSLQKGKLSDDDWQRLASVSDRLSDLSILIDDTPAIPILEIRSKCRRLKSNKKWGLDLIIVDYLQLMENKSIENREQQIADISRNLKSLAKELEVPVIALSQLNRQIESRTNKRPLLSDLRESGAIEQDADVILFIYRDEYYDKNTAEKNIAEILVEKNRSGPTTSVRLGFFNAYTKFKNLSDSF